MTGCFWKAIDSVYEKPTGCRNSRVTAPERTAFRYLAQKPYFVGDVAGLPSEKGTKPFLFKMSSGCEYHLSGTKSSGRTKHSPAKSMSDTNQQ